MSDSAPNSTGLPQGEGRAARRGGELGGASPQGEGRAARRVCVLGGDAGAGAGLGGGGGFARANFKRVTKLSLSKQSPKPTRNSFNSALISATLMLCGSLAKSAVVDDVTSVLETNAPVSCDSNSSKAAVMKMATRLVVFMVLVVGSLLVFRENKWRV